MAIKVEDTRHPERGKKKTVWDRLTRFDRLMTIKIVNQQVVSINHLKAWVVQRGTTVVLSHPEVT